MTLARRTGEVKFVAKGDKGDAGASLEKVPWEAGKIYYCGAVGEIMKHIVLYQSLWYLCIRTHTSSQALNPKDNVATGSVKYFSVATQFDLIKADVIDVNSLIVNRLQTNGPARVVIENGLIEIFGAIARNISFGVDDNGMAVMKYFNNAGIMLYDLGPEGLTKVPVVEEKWVPVRMILLGTTEATAIANTSAYKYNAIISSTPTYYRYVSKRVAGVIDDPVNDGLLFTHQSKSTKIPNGYYCDAVSYAKQDGSHHMLYHTDNTNQVITIDGMKSNQKLFDRAPLYHLYINYFVSGALSTYFMCGWNGGIGDV